MVNLNCIEHLERTSRIEERVEYMEHSLLGNGQPGEIEKLRNEIKELRKTLTRITIIVVGLAGASGAGLPTILKMLGL